MQRDNIDMWQLATSDQSNVSSILSESDSVSQTQVSGHTQDVERLHALLRVISSRAGSGGDSLVWHNVASRSLLKQVHSTAMEARDFVESICPDLALQDTPDVGAAEAKHAKTVKSALLLYSNAHRAKLKMLGSCPPITKEYWQKVKKAWVDEPVEVQQALEDIVKHEVETQFPGKDKKLVAVALAALQDAEVRGSVQPQSMPLEISQDESRPETGSSRAASTSESTILAALPPSTRRMVSQTMWFNDGSPSLPQSDSGVVLPFSDRGKLFADMFKGDATKREKTFKSMVAGFARDRGVIPRALVQKLPHRVVSPLARKVADQVSALFRRWVAKPEAKARKLTNVHKLCQHLDVLLHFHSKASNVSLSHVVAMPVISFGAKIGANLGAGQLQCL